MPLPYQGTKVPVSRSIMKIKDLLYEQNFNGFAEKVKPDGSIEILATIEKDNQAILNFSFTVNWQAIQDLAKSRLDDKQAQRMAWRCLFNQVKSLTDSIKLGIISVPEAFAGNMALIDNKGNPVKVGTFFVELALAGNFNQESFNKKLLGTG